MSEETVPVTTWKMACRCIYMEEAGRTYLGNIHLQAQPTLNRWWGFLQRKVGDQKVCLRICEPKELVGVEVLMVGATVRTSSSLGEESPCGPQLLLSARSYAIVCACACAGACAGACACT
jgi:hypothetical protein